MACLASENQLTLLPTDYFFKSNVYVFVYE